MNFRDIAVAATLGVAGLMAAIGIAVAVNSITGADLGLSSEPVSLATGSGAAKPAPAPGAERDDNGGDRSDDDAGAAATTTVEDGGGGDDSSGPGGGDDKGAGRDRGESPNSGPGKPVDDKGDNSGKGSSGSGSGSGGPGSGKPDPDPDPVKIDD